jgi:hypothetical protein
MNWGALARFIAAIFSQEALKRAILEDSLASYSGVPIAGNILIVKEDIK